MNFGKNVRLRKCTTKIQIWAFNEIFCGKYLCYSGVYNQVGKEQVGIAYSVILKRQNLNQCTRHLQ